MTIHELSQCFEGYSIGWMFDIAAGWQACCDVCGSNSVVLFLMVDVIGILFKFMHVLISLR